MTSSRRARALRLVGGVLVVLVLQPARLAAKELPKPQLLSDLCPSAAIASLQQQQADGDGVFVVQREVDRLVLFVNPDGGGGCAVATGINVLQCLRAIAGEEPLANPHQALLKLLSDQPQLLEGRVTNEGLTELIGRCQEWLPDRGVDVSVLVGSHSPLGAGYERWDAAGPKLAVKPRELTLLTYEVRTEAGKVLGRHFVVLRRVVGNKIDVLDPFRPHKDSSYVLEYQEDPKGGPTRVYLLRPVGVPVTTDIYELDTLFRVTVNAEQSGNVTLRPTAAAIEHVKSQIDKTDRLLKGTDDFLNPRRWRKETAAFGLPGLDLPPACGGSGWSARQVLDIFRHAGRYNLNFRDVVGGAHSRPLLNSDDPAVLEVVRQVARGDGYVAILLTEPSAGSDLKALATEAVKVDGGYRITGEKRYNARLAQASHMLVFAQVPEDPPGWLTAFLLPSDAQGVAIKTLEAHGLAGNSYGGAVFDGVFVSEAMRIGDQGDGSKLFFEHFPYWRLMQVAAAIGTGEKALEKMAARIATREAFGAPIGRFTHLQQALGQSTTELRMAYALACDAADQLDRGDYRGARAMISGLKAEGVEAALRAADAAMRAHGGMGYSDEVDLGDRVRDLMGLRIADGTTDVMRMDVVRQAYGEEFWEMAIEND
ncbi:acyl-CoA dehydrogenase family protein [Botrimarina mediterranea]|nr:acyl-CoA dehydrogenase family protein [Botrimarina mediterranea]